MIETICIYCAASLGKNPDYQLAAYALGREIAHRKMKIVYGGGGTGLMGVIAEAALEHGGHVTGIIPEGLIRREAQHRNLSETHVVTSMHQRKAMMAERADAFVALPGGFGTYEELFEVITWAQLGIHFKPIVIFNTLGYFDHFLKGIEHASEEGFIRYPNLFMVASEVSEVFTLMENWKPNMDRPRWMDKAQI